MICSAVWSRALKCFSPNVSLYIQGRSVLQDVNLARLAFGPCPEYCFFLWGGVIKAPHTLTHSLGDFSEIGSFSALGTRHVSVGVTWESLVDLVPRMHA